MTTENHDYNTPEKGTIEWHVPLNENFKRLDAAVEIRDAEANLNQYSPKSGAKFFATDTGKRFLGDGEAWIEAPPQPLTDLVVPQTTSDPSDPVLGELWYREDTNSLKVKLAGEVQSLATGVEDTTETDDGSNTETGSGSGGTHTLEIVPADGADWDKYTAVIDGEVLATENTNTGDSVTQQSDGTVLIDGGVKGGKDPERYDYSGTLVDLSLTVDGTAFVDGQAVDPADY